MKKQETNMKKKLLMLFTAGTLLFISQISYSARLSIEDEGAWVGNTAIAQYRVPLDKEEAIYDHLVRGPITLSYIAPDGEEVVETTVIDSVPAGYKASLDEEVTSYDAIMRDLVVERLCLADAIEYTRIAEEAHIALKRVQCVVEKEDSERGFRRYSIIMTRSCAPQRNLGCATYSTGGSGGE